MQILKPKKSKQIPLVFCDEYMCCTVETSSSFSLSTPFLSIMNSKKWTPSWPCMCACTVPVLGSTLRPSPSFLSPSLNLSSVVNLPVYVSDLFPLLSYSLVHPAHIIFVPSPTTTTTPAWLMSSLFLRRAACPGGRDSCRGCRKKQETVDQTL